MKLRAVIILSNCEFVLMDKLAVKVNDYRVVAGRLRHILDIYLKITVTPHL